MGRRTVDFSPAYVGWGSGYPSWDFSWAGICVMLACMGNKDRGKKEAKKAPKPKPKPEPSKREIFTPAPPK
jgi:hypothetical protein